MTPQYSFELKECSFGLELEEQCHIGACSFIRDFDIHGILKIIKAS